MRKKKLKLTEDNLSYKNMRLTVTHHRDRIGCDICKRDTATQAYIGFVGDVLWICGHCFKKITKKKKGVGS